MSSESLAAPIAASSVPARMTAPKLSAGEEHGPIRDPVPHVAAERPARRGGSPEAEAAWHRSHAAPEIGVARTTRLGLWRRLLDDISGHRDALLLRARVELELRRDEPRRRNLRVGLLAMHVNDDRQRFGLLSASPLVADAQAVHVWIPQKLIAKSRLGLFCHGVHLHSVFDFYSF
jgi:hypothetical protein